MSQGVVVSTRPTSFIRRELSMRLNSPTIDDLGEEDANDEANVLGYIGYNEDGLPHLECDFFDHYIPISDKGNIEIEEGNVVLFEKTDKKKIKIVTAKVKKKIKERAPVIKLRHLLQTSIIASIVLTLTIFSTRKR